MKNNNKQKFSLRIFGLMIAITSQILPNAQAQSLSEKRADAEQKGREFISAGFKIEASLKKIEGPNSKSGFFSKLNGCPAAPVSEPNENLAIAIKPGKLTSWAGDFDGVNVDSVKNSNYSMVGYGLVIPKGSTGDSDAKNNQSFEFQIGDPFLVQRAMVDTAAEKFDRCFAEYADSDLTFEQILEKCPVQNVTKQEQGQTCVLNVFGRVYDQPAGENRFVAKVHETTRCDFIGYDKNSGDGNTGFTTCWVAFYEGTAELGYDNELNSSLVSKSARSRIAKSCKNRNSNLKAMSRCIKSRINKMMKK
jgi:hypothetical protein